MSPLFDAHTYIPPPPPEDPKKKKKHKVTVTTTAHPSPPLPSEANSLTFRAHVTWNATTQEGNLLSFDSAVKESDWARPEQRPPSTRKAEHQENFLIQMYHSNLRAERDDDGWD